MKALMTALIIVAGLTLIGCGAFDSKPVQQAKGQVHLAEAEATREAIRRQQALNDLEIEQQATLQAVQVTAAVKRIETGANTEAAVGSAVSASVRMLGYSIAVSLPLLALGFLAWYWNRLRFTSAAERKRAQIIDLGAGLRLLPGERVIDTLTGRIASLSDGSIGGQERAVIMARLEEVKLLTSVMERVSKHKHQVGAADNVPAIPAGVPFLHLEDNEVRRERE